MTPSRLPWHGSPGSPDRITWITGITWPEHLEKDHLMMLEAITTPIEADCLRTLQAAATEAEAALGTPSFHTLARHYHRLAETFRDTFGWDPRPSEVCP